MPITLPNDVSFCHSTAVVIAGENIGTAYSIAAVELLESPSGQADLDAHDIVHAPRTSDRAPPPRDGKRGRSFAGNADGDPLAYR